MGLTVSYRPDGDLDKLDRPASEAAYRVIQESLTNALKHAPGAPIARLCERRIHHARHRGDQRGDPEARPRQGSNARAAVTGSSGIASSRRSVRRNARSRPHRGRRLARRRSTPLLGGAAELVDQVGDRVDDPRRPVREALGLLAAS